MARRRNSVCLRLGLARGALRIICRSGRRGDQHEPIRHRLCCNASAQYRQQPHSRNQNCSGAGIRSGYRVNRESATERTIYRGLRITSLGCATEQPGLSIGLCHRAPWVCYRANQLQRSRDAAILRITSRHNGHQQKQQRNNTATPERENGKCNRKQQRDKTATPHQRERETRDVHFLTTEQGIQYTFVSTPAKSQRCDPRAPSSRKSAANSVAMSVGARQRHATDR